MRLRWESTQKYYDENPFSRSLAFATHAPLRARERNSSTSFWESPSAAFGGEITSLFSGKFRGGGPLLASSYELCSIFPPLAAIRLSTSVGFGGRGSLMHSSPSQSLRGLVCVCVYVGAQVRAKSFKTRFSRQCRPYINDRRTT